MKGQRRPEQPEEEPEHAQHAVQVTSWEDVPGDSEVDMTKALARTPIITAICAGPALDAWHHYTGGIFDEPCCEKEEEIALDHGIVVVGYGQENGVDYWVLRNSWGTAWGEQGYMRIRRNYGKHGKCAMAMVPAMVFRGEPPPAAAAVGADGTRGKTEVAAVAVTSSHQVPAAVATS